MKKAFYLILFLICTAGVYAQKQEQALIDSLLTVLPKAKQDTNRVMILNELSRQNCLVTHYDTAFYYARNAMQLAEKLSFKKGMATSYNSIGNIYRNQGNYPEALKSLFAGLKINKAISNKDGTGASYFGIANVYNSQGNYPEALENYFAALKIHKATGNKQKIADVSNNLGLVYYSQGNYPEALKNYFAALKTCEATGNKKGMAASYNNIGNIYYSQGDYPETLKNYFAALKISKAAGNKQGIAVAYGNIGIVSETQNNHPEALKYFFASLKINEAIGDKTGMAHAYNNIGATYKAQRNYPEALKSLFASLKILEAIENKNGIAFSCNSIGNVYTKLNQPLQAKEWLRKGLSLSRKIGAKETIKNSYSGLIKTDSLSGNYKEAFEHYKMYVTYRDSLVNEANTKQQTQTEMQYVFDKKQLADSIKNMQAKKLVAVKLQQQKAYTWSGAGIALLMLAFSGFIFTSRKKLATEKQKSESLLHNILPEEISNELKERGAATARQFNSVSILFTDFVDFTKAGERMNPQELVNELHNCFKYFDGIIGKYNIEKIKTIGDAYLAACGLPNEEANHARNIVNAALEIRQFMLARKDQLGDKTFDIRIGIHSGSVVAGIVGIKKFAYDIWGDTVNMAARMEQSSEAGKINISETTYQLIKDDFSCEYRGEIEAKNKGLLKMYFVTSKTEAK